MGIANNDNRYENEEIVPECPVVVYSAGRIRENFMYRHFRSNVAVVQEGVEPLPHCDLCRIHHIPAGWIIKHWSTAQCDKNSQIWWWGRYVAIVDECSEENFSLTGDYGVE